MEYEPEYNGYIDRINKDVSFFHPRMSGPSESATKKTEFIESFEERIDLLFEELSFAIQWQRPSILLAFCERENLRDIAGLFLEKRLAEIGQQVVQFKVTERRFDIPRLLSKRPDRDHSVYFVTGLSRGGGKDCANAYRALNIRREYFVDYAIRVIIWLAKGEEIELSRHASDIWAFRHRVVEFDDHTNPDVAAILAKEASGRAQGFSSQPKDLDEQIRIAKRLNNVVLQAQFLGNLGFTYLGSDQPTRAIRAFWKAIRFNPLDAAVHWIGLGQAYFMQGRVNAARSAFKKAAKAELQDKNA